MGHNAVAESIGNKTGDACLIGSDVGIDQFDSVGAEHIADLVVSGRIFLKSDHAAGG